MAHGPGRARWRVVRQHGHGGHSRRFEARERRDAPVAFVAFDVLQLKGQNVMSAPWSDRRKRLEDIGATLAVPNVTIVPVTEDAPQLWATWVGWGGEGIVLKDRRSVYRPGVRSPDWLKVKHRQTPAVTRA
jgi:bifunctional non-homologous end joining protein LigD